MKTAQNIVDLMTDEMPFKLNPDIVPYIIEAMKLYANEKLDEVSKKATIIGDFWGKECDECEYFDTEHGIRMTVNKKSILSLKDQI